MNFGKMPSLAKLTSQIADEQAFQGAKVYSILIKPSKLSGSWSLKLSSLICQIGQETLWEQILWYNVLHFQL